MEDVSNKWLEYFPNEWMKDVPNEWMENSDEHEYSNIRKFFV